MSRMPDRNHTLALLTTLFFLWGFMTVLNDVLIPHLKALFTLTYARSMLVQMAFFGAYFTGSVLYYLLSLTAGDPINKIGYKNGLVAGLVLAAGGSMLFYPATLVQAYWFYLLALYVLGLGFTLLQIAANPFVAIAGPPETASGRLNLAQGFNSLGTTLGPLVGGFFIFKYFAGADAVKYPYLFFGLVMLALAVVVARSRLPEFRNREQMAKGLAVLRFPRLRLGIPAIFFYVGAEVVIGSLLINLLALEEVAGLPEHQAKTYLSLYWGGAMAGRFGGAVMHGRTGPGRVWLLAGALLAGAAGALALNYTGGTLGAGEGLLYLLFVVLNFGAFLLGRGQVGRTLAVFSLVIIVLLGLVISQQGVWVLWPLVAIGLFNSIMWPNIFTLAIEGLGPYTSQGSSLLVMAIVGGALIPVVQGLVADSLATPGHPDAGLRASFIVPLFSYLYLTFYGLWAERHRAGQSATI